MNDAIESELAVLHVDRNHVLGPEPAFQEQFGDRVLDLLLDRALQRACAVARIEADVGVFVVTCPLWTYQ